MTTSVRLSLLLCLSAACSLLAGCAHQSLTAHDVRLVAPPPLTITSVVTPASEAPAVDPLEPIEAATDTEAAASSEPQAVPPRTVVRREPGDLLERLRAGFRLEDVNQTAVDRELNWFANNPEYLERVFGRAELYIHYIVEQLEKRNMPRELALLPVIESAFEPYAYSKARASGLWQFIPGTGSNYGLKQNWWYDGRRDVIESTRAALDYLQALHDEFDGDWLLAVAGYNCGEGAVERAIRKNLAAGKPADFWHLKLPTETRAYVPKLLAMSRLMANPAKYGLEFSRIPDEAYFTSVDAGGQIDLQVVAELAGITKDEIYELNPAFHRWATDPNGPHTLLMPLEVADGLEQTLLGLSPEQRMRVEHYTVRRADTVASVAKHYATTATVLRELNGMAPADTLAIGGELRVPSNSVQLPDKAARAAELVDRRLGGTVARRGTRPSVHVVRRGDTLSSIARRLGTDIKTLASLNDMQVGDTLRAGQQLVVAASSSKASATRTTTAKANDSGDGKRVTYTVRRGDTLSSIARVLRVTVSELLGWNGMSKSSIIKPGQKLVAFVSSRG